MDINEYLIDQKKLVENALDEYLPLEESYPGVIHKAMRYSVFSGGKRIRPIMSIIGFNAYEGKGEKILPISCSIELIHTYSLVHDDLPDIDNDDLRRGKPSCHKKFSPAVAILTGNSLLIEGFKLLTFLDNDLVVKKLVSYISEKIGSCGMNGGQIVDIQRNFEFKKVKKMEEDEKNNFLKKSEYINAHKTAALIEAAFVSGALTAGAKDEDIKNIEQYAYYIGFLFQLIDDIIDKDGYVSIVGLSETIDKAQGFLKKAKGKALEIDSENEILTQLPDYIFKRANY